MYVIRFETGKVSRKIKNWEDKLFNDFHRKIDNLSYQYKTKSKALKRLQFIVGRSLSFNKNSYIKLNDKEYGKRNLPVTLWGLPQGYVNLESKLSQAEKEGIVKIELRDFYDIRQNAKVLKNSYLVIEYNN